jgi:NIMA (never in mitosis gene a)-related kinase
MVKSLLQVSPQLRPTCDKILDMPVVKKRIDRLFPSNEFYDSKTSLLNTIRVPKNILYLTDRLPKPNYQSPGKKMDEEEKLRRKTYDPS